MTFALDWRRGTQVTVPPMPEVRATPIDFLLTRGWTLAKFQFQITIAYAVLRQKSRIASARFALFEMPASSR